MDHFLPIRSLLDQIINDASGPLKAELEALRKPFGAGKAKPAQKKALTTLSEALETTRAMVERYGHKGRYGKLIKKKKPKADAQEQILELITDLQKALFLVQLTVLVTAQTATDAERRVLWVDDNPENNTKEADAAKASYAIDVVQTVSTAEAQAYLAAHPELKTAASNEFRIITDCFRVDEGEDAGLNLVKWLRGNGWTAPVLVYCGNMMNVLEMQSQHSLLLTSSTSTQLDMFFASMAEPSAAGPDGKEPAAAAEPKAKGKGKAAASKAKSKAKSAVVPEAVEAPPAEPDEPPPLEPVADGTPPAPPEIYEPLTPEPMETDQRLERPTVEATLEAPAEIYEPLEQPSLQKQSSTSVVAPAAPAVRAASVASAASQTTSLAVEATLEAPATLYATPLDSMPDEPSFQKRASSGSVSGAQPSGVSEEAPPSPAKKASSAAAFSARSPSDAAVNRSASSGAASASLPAEARASTPSPDSVPAAAPNRRTSDGRAATFFLRTANKTTQHVGRLETVKVVSRSDEDIDMELFQVRLDGPVRLEGFISDDGDSTLAVTYFPTRPGLYTLHVTYDGDEVAMSPFTFDVIQPPVDKKRKPEPEPPMSSSSSAPARKAVSGALPRPPSPKRAASAIIDSPQRAPSDGSATEPEPEPESVPLAPNLEDEPSYRAPPKKSATSAKAVATAPAKVPAAPSMRYAETQAAAPSYEFGFAAAKPAKPMTTATKASSSAGHDSATEEEPEPSAADVNTSTATLPYSDNENNDGPTLPYDQDNDAGSTLPYDEPTPVKPARHQPSDDDDRPTLPYDEPTPIKPARAAAASSDEDAGPTLPYDEPAPIAPAMTTKGGVSTAIKRKATVPAADSDSDDARPTLPFEFDDQPPPVKKHKAASDTSEDDVGPTLPFDDSYTMAMPAMPKKPAAKTESPNDSFGGWESAVNISQGSSSSGSQSQAPSAAKPSVVPKSSPVKWSAPKSKPNALDDGSDTEDETYRID
eukprot:TRINITY_DN1085_c0_g5_i1.p1 TRINITY_DN1085_c0_g5~~TRINITY_DN1085_c0_g5_i1.p1  ORF type:complete len:987 (-),score=351.91 TRINITY_DN1085_c0_g5_i1:134-3094(-)